MHGNRIICDSCHVSWALGVPFTVYTQQAMESTPCPHCGANTLRCQPAGERLLSAAQRRRHSSVLSLEPLKPAARRHSNHKAAPRITA